MKYLNNMEVIRWCYEGITDKTSADFSDAEKLKKYQKIEKKWGNNVMGTIDAKQWTTVLCQELVREALTELGRSGVRNTKNLQGAIATKAYSPDLECDQFVYEVKGRSWCTTGTAGEKILGVPLKYAEVPKVYGKPLKIVLVGYQEYEARKGFAFGDLLDPNAQIPEITVALDFYKEREIEYVAFTDILKEIGYDYGCWEK